MTRDKLGRQLWCMKPFGDHNGMQALPCLWLCCSTLLAIKDKAALLEYNVGLSLVTYVEPWVSSKAMG